MKKTFKFLVLIVSLFIFSGCDYLGSIFNDDLSAEELKFKLLESRSEIQKQNIIVKTTIDLGILKGTIIQEGSGITVKEDESYYYILTNSHVVDYKGTETPRSVKVTMESYYQDSFVPERVITATKYDLSLFKISKDKFINKLTPINIDARLTDYLAIGEMVLTVGNPGETTFNVTYGAYEGTPTLKNVDYRVLRHNATIFSGNSGGALTDIDGNLVGINTWGYEEQINKGFAIGLSEIHEFLDSYFSESNSGE